MKNKKTESYKTCLNMLPPIVEAGLRGDHQAVELLALGVIRKVRSEAPQVAMQLAELIGNTSIRTAGSLLPTPADEESGYSLLRFINTDELEQPFFTENLERQITSIIAERRSAANLVAEGYAPTKSLLLVGPPGTGKTMLAGWLARELELPLAVLDLSSAISSLLGKTGANLRKILDYARASPCVLLLDEFDAIAKRRDDSSEVGELKRIVNVLLKELESWPISSILVGATNHPEILDPAIQRRFDVVLNIPMPNSDQARAIILRAGGRFVEGLPSGFQAFLVKSLHGLSGSMIDSLVRRVVVRHLIQLKPLEYLFIEAIIDQNIINDITTVIKRLRVDCGCTVRQIASLTKKSPSTVQYHLSKLENNKKHEAESDEQI